MHDTAHIAVRTCDSCMKDEGKEAFDDCDDNKNVVIRSLKEMMNDE